MQLPPSPPDLEPSADLELSSCCLPVLLLTICWVFGSTLKKPLGCSRPQDNTTYSGVPSGLLFDIEAFRGRQLRPVRADGPQVEAGVLVLGSHSISPTELLGLETVITSGPDVEQRNIWPLPVIGLLLGMERSFNHFKHQPVALSPSW